MRLRARRDLAVRDRERNLHRLRQWSIGRQSRDLPGNHHVFLCGPRIDSNRHQERRPLPVQTVFLQPQSGYCREQRTSIYPAPGQRRESISVFLKMLGDAPGELCELFRASWDLLLRAKNERVRLQLHRH